MYHIYLLLFIFLAFYSNSITADLYNSSDPMIILDNKNFYKTVQGAQNTWIIEFYNSWCGHCMNFVPVWRQFAEDIKDWNHMVKVAVIDCSDAENVPICRDYDVMGYPTIRLLGANLQKGDLGETVEERQGLQEAVVKFLIRNEENKTSLIEKDNFSVSLSRYRGSIKDIFNVAKKDAKYAIIIVEDNPDSVVGAEVILDLGHYAVVYVRRVASTNEEGIKGVVLVDRDGKRETLADKASIREEITAVIKEYLRVKKELPLNDSVVYTPLKSNEEIEGAGDGIPEETHRTTTFISAHNNNNKAEQVYITDIENALTYILRNEVPLHKLIEQERLESLKMFLKSLIFLPMREEVLHLVLKLSKYVNAHKERLHGQDFLTAIEYMENSTEISFLPRHQPWIGCQGSQPKYRGYPCALWTLFHALTVNSVLNGATNATYNPKDVLRAIHGYVKFFFGCDYCSRHFQEMYSLDAESSVLRPNDEILWLWMAHNKVNERLKGDASEDPAHPKQLFPSRLSCPSCWKPDGTFNTSEVLLYLKTAYESGSISLSGIQSLVKKPWKSDRVANYKPHRFTSEDLGSISGGNVWGFNNTDISLCLMIYILSTLVILVGYSMFVMKKRLRKQKMLEKYNLV